MSDQQPSSGELLTTRLFLWFVTFALFGLFIATVISNRGPLAVVIMGGLYGLCMGIACYFENINDLLNNQRGFNSTPFLKSVRIQKRRHNLRIVKGGKK